MQPDRTANRGPILARSLPGLLSCIVKMQLSTVLSYSIGITQDCLIQTLRFDEICCLNETVLSYSNGIIPLNLKSKGTLTQLFLYGIRI